MNKEQQRFIDTMGSLNYTGDQSYYGILHYKPRKLPYSQAKKILEYWGIVDTESAHATLTWFLEEGLRKDFNRIRNILLFMSDADREHWVSSLEDEKTRNQFKAVNRYLHKLNSSSIAGADYGFCVMFAQNAFRMGFISLDDSDEYALQAGRKAQKDFPNWSDYLISHSAGAEFNKENEETTVTFMKSQQFTLTRVLTAPNSPLRKVSWNTNLAL
ncbi:DUF1266 domain-containing protein [Rossellomorea marisflavi]|uniref:DUF1266 domain-containing protein n=1 Tax=Rossellomorea marisflavi TaxID=189381 RepID=UPI00064E8968|nr:DUF1266 domain-containing protein [Rossellomorea marisflavi]KMK95761.1 hypothetical protein VL03_06130 [Rossellomorea marisflavi]